MRRDDGKQLVETRLGLRHGASRECAVELLRLEGGIFGLAIAKLVTQVLDGVLNDKRAGGLALGVNRRTGVATLALDVPVGFAAAVVDAGLQVKGVSQALDFRRMGGAQRSDGVVLLGNLALEAHREDGSLSAALCLSHRSTNALHGGIHATEALTHGRLRAGRLHQVIPANAVDVCAHGRQGVVQQVDAVPTAAATVAAATVVPVPIAAPGTADRTADGAARKRAPAAAPTIMAAAATQRNNGLKPAHFTSHS